jgi:hypothetical protein
VDIFYLTCPECSGEYYADTSLLSLDVTFHCPFCGAYFKKKKQDAVDSDPGISPIVRMSRGKTFYAPASEKS